MTVPLTLVVNPTAGGGRAASYLPKVTAVLDAAGATYTVSKTTSLEHACLLAAEAAGRGDTVVAFGGDGLASALAGTVAQAVARAAADKTQQSERHPPAARVGAFGIIPAGHGNDIARTMRIPFEPAAAARVLVEGVPQPVDLIAVTGAGADPEPIIAAGTVYVGIASVAGEIANRLRRIPGPIVYNIAALAALIGWKPTTFEMETTGADGRQATLKFRGFAVVIANTPYFGGGMQVAPGASCTDGVLDVVLMRHGPKLAFIRVLARIKKGTHLALAQVSTQRATAVTLTVDRPMPVGADGELLAVSPPLAIRAMPAALDVIVPRNAVEDTGEHVRETESVEITVTDDAAAVSKHKAGAGRLILMRDSKNPDGPVLAFTEAEWRAFIAGVKDGEFDDLG